MSQRLIPQAKNNAQRLDQLAQRYFNPQVIEHLAEQYVLGLLTPLAQQRLEGMLSYHGQLHACVTALENKLIGLDNLTPQLAPRAATWNHISEHIGLHEAKKQPQSATPMNLAARVKNGLQGISSTLERWWQSPMPQLASAFSMVCIALLVMFSSFDESKQDPLSYVAVLTQHNGDAHMVASTYGHSQTLVVNIVKAVKPLSDQSLELWVVSKTDAQARSLGLVSVDTSLFEQQLTTAQWRLIKDSQSLIVTVEELGGSAIGEPSEMIVSRGLCVRLQEWASNV